MTKKESKKETKKEIEIKDVNDKDVEKEKPKKKSKYSEDQFRWYIVQSYAKQEDTVAKNIKQRVKANNLEDEISEILVPTQEKVVIKAGKKNTIQEKIFPGYILIRMVMADKTWSVIKGTEGVTNFIGINNKPKPLSEQEVKGIVDFTHVKQPTFESSFEVGNSVKIVDGPFKDFMGTINEINEGKGQVKVLVSIFGRETPIVLDFLQVNKM